MKCFYNSIENNAPVAKEEVDGDNLLHQTKYTRFSAVKFKYLGNVNSP